MQTLSKELYFNEEDKIYINKSVYFPSLQEHSHEFLEIVYICSGSGIHTINSREYKVTKGDLFFINYKVAHTFLPVSEDFRWINCLFLPEILDESLIHSENARDLLQQLLFKPFFDQYADFLFDINLMNRQREFNYIFEDMLKEYEKKGNGYRLILKSYLMVLLSKIFRLASEKDSSQQGGKEREVINKVLDYLQRNYAKAMRLEDVARQTLLSPTYFAAVFKNATGQSLFEYIHKIRVEEACKLITETEGSITEIMLEVGYSDSKFFYQIFKRYTNMTPGEYRKREK